MAFNFVYLTKGYNSYWAGSESEPPVLKQENKGYYGGIKGWVCLLEGGLRSNFEHWSICKGPYMVALVSNARTPGVGTGGSGVWSQTELQERKKREVCLILDKSGEIFYCGALPLASQILFKLLLNHWSQKLNLATEWGLPQSSAKLETLCDWGQFRRSRNPQYCLR